MGIFDFLKKKEKGSLPPPPPPGKGGLPPLPRMDLEKPPSPQMPVPQKPAPLPSMDLPPIPESLEEPPAAPPTPPKPPVMPKLKEERPAIPVVRAKLPAPKEVEEKYDKRPAIVQDRTVQKPTPARVPVRETAPEAPASQQAAVPQVRTAPRVVRKTPEEIFISVGDYQEMMDSMDRIQQTIEDSEQLITRLHELKTNEEDVLEEWKTHLEDVEKKLSYVDQVIFEGE